MLVACRLAGLTAPEFWTMPLRSRARNSGRRNPGQRIRVNKGAPVGVE